MSITGINLANIKIELYDAKNNLVAVLSAESRPLNSYPVQDFMRLHVRAFGVSIYARYITKTHQFNRSLTPIRTASRMRSRTCRAWKSTRCRRRSTISARVCV